VIAFQQLFASVFLVPMNLRFITPGRRDRLPRLAAVLARQSAERSTRYRSRAAVAGGRP
jgi:hypothetical protein